MQSCSFFGVVYFFLSVDFSAAFFFRPALHRRIICTRYGGVGEDISVYDDVLANGFVELVDAHARVGGLGHSCMDRRSVRPRTAVESAIETCLDTLGNQAPYVEYWWREEWICLEAHRDIDELLARDEDNSCTIKENIRYPTQAHVYYLDVGNDVCGPTIVFHDDKDNGDYNEKVKTKSSLKACTVVHAKKNRLMRMKGDILHAVPRPELCYFNQDVGGSNNMIWTREKRECVPQPERRSVLLFNTWEVAPHDISLEPPEGSMKAAKEDAAATMNNFQSSTRGEFLSVDIEDNSKNAEETTRMKVGLLGDIVRRGKADRYLELQGDWRLVNTFRNKDSSHKKIYSYQVFEV